MAITTPNFSTAESLATPANVTFTDTSVGSDGGLTERRIYCRLANGNWLTTGGVESSTEAYTVWAIADTSTTISLLTRSTTSNVTVKWMTGTVATYTKTILCEWDLYDYLFAFELLQSQTATPTIVSDTNYYNNFFMFLTNLWNSENSVTVGSDLYSSQSSLDKNYNLITNQNLYF